MSIQVSQTHTNSLFAPQNKQNKTNNDLNFNELLKKEQLTENKIENKLDLDKLNTLSKDNFSKITKALENLKDANTGEKLDLNTLDENQLEKLINFMAEKLFMFQNNFKNDIVDFQSVELNFADDQVYGVISFQNEKGQMLNPLKSMFNEEKIANSKYDFSAFEKQGKALNENISNGEYTTMSKIGEFEFWDAQLIEDLWSSDPKTREKASHSFLKQLGIDISFLEEEKTQDQIKEVKNIEIPQNISNKVTKDFIDYMKNIETLFDIFLNNKNSKYTQNTNFSSLNNFLLGNESPKADENITQALKQI